MILRALEIFRTSFISWVLLAGAAGTTFLPGFQSTLPAEIPVCPTSMLYQYILPVYLTLPATSIPYQYTLLVPVYHTSISYQYTQDRIRQDRFR